jgi:hypothetical protein
MSLVVRLDEVDEERPTIERHYAFVRNKHAAGRWEPYALGRGYTTALAWFATVRWSNLGKRHPSREWKILPAKWRVFVETLVTPPTVLDIRIRKDCGKYVTAHFMEEFSGMGQTGRPLGRPAVLYLRRNPEGLQ